MHAWKLFACNFRLPRFLLDMFITPLHKFQTEKKKRNKQRFSLSLLQSRLLDVIQIELFPFCDFELLHIDESRVGRL